MKLFFLSAVFLSLIVFAPCYGLAVMLDFEDLYTETWGLVDNTYGGFNWDGGDRTVHYVNGPNFGGGYAVGAISGSMVAYNGSGQQSIIDWVGTETFTFNSAYFTSAWTDDKMIYFSGYNDGQLIYTSQEFYLSTTAPALIELNWSGIDSLEINSDTSYNWVMDNFIYNESAPVPEPATMLLLSTGLIGLAGFGRRKLTKK